MIHPHTMPAVPAYPIPRIQLVDSFTSCALKREHTIVQSTRERRQQAKNSKTDTECRPQREFTLKLLFISQCHDHPLISIHIMVRIWHIAIRQDRRNGSMIGISVHATFGGCRFRQFSVHIGAGRIIRQKGILCNTVEKRDWI